MKFDFYMNGKEVSRKEMESAWGTQYINECIEELEQIGKSATMFLDENGIDEIVSYK